MKGKTFIAFIALLIGCATGVAARNAVLPIAEGQGVKVVQHHCTELKWDEVLGEQNLRPDLGNNGWELATFVSAVKRGARLEAAVGGAVRGFGGAQNQTERSGVMILGGYPKGAPARPAPGRPRPPWPTT
jgi:hypothetical protein